MSRRRGLGDCWSGTEAVSSPHRSLLLVFLHALCLCVRAVDLAGVCGGCGKGICLCWCLGAAGSCADYSSVCYIWRGWIPPKTFVENWFWVPFITWVLCVTVHSLRTQGSYSMSSAYFKFPRRFTEKCIWTWDWVLWIILSLVMWLFLTEVLRSITRYANR